MEMPCRPDTRATAALQGVVDADDDRARRDEGSHNHVQQGAGQREPGPGIAVEHAVESGEAGCSANPRARRQLVTVRGPTAGSAPVFRPQW